MASNHKGPFHGLISAYKEAAVLPASTVNEDLEMFSDSDCWSTVVELIDLYHQRFPQNFSELKAQPFLLAAAHLEFRNDQSLLSKIQKFIKGNPHLEEAVREGIERAHNVRRAPPVEGSGPICAPGQAA